MGANGLIYKEVSMDYKKLFFKSWKGDKLISQEIKNVKLDKPADLMDFLLGFFVEEKRKDYFSEGSVFNNCRLAWTKDDDTNEEEIELTLSVNKHAITELYTDEEIQKIKDCILKQN